MVLVAALLPGGIAVAVPDFKPDTALYGLLELLQFQKFRAVVCGQAFELLPEIRGASLQPVKYSPDSSRFPIWQFENQLLPGHSFCQGQKYRPAPGFTHYHIHFPVPVFFPLVDVLGAVCYAG